MSQSFPIKADLPKQDQAELDRISAISSGLRNASETAFLNARLQYLTNEIIETDSTGNILECRGNTVPVNGLSGFAKGCTFIKIDAAGGVVGNFVNIGITSACQFQQVTNFNPGQFDLVKFSVLSVPQTVSGNATMAFDGYHTAYYYQAKSSHSEIYGHNLLTGEIAAITNGSLLDEAYAGATMVYASGKLYFTRGGGYAALYSITPSGTLSYLTNCPTNINFGCAMAYDGNDSIYLLTATTLQRYSISGNSWTALTAPASGVTEGASLAFVGNGKLYALKGGGTTTAWVYDVSGDSWSSIAATPGTVYDGAALAWAGGNAVYALRGIGSQGFWRYHIGINAWETLDNLPIPASTGSTLLPLGGGHFLAYIAEPSGITSFGVVNNLYFYSGYHFGATR